MFLYEPLSQLADRTLECQFVCSLHSECRLDPGCHLLVTLPGCALRLLGLRAASSACRTRAFHSRMVW